MPDKHVDVVAVRVPTTDIIERIKKATKNQELLVKVPVTGEMAKDLLTLNHGNRDPAQVDIEKMTYDMLNGKWQFIGNTFKIDYNMRLFDGQKELISLAFACEKKPDLVFYFHIQCGLDPNAHKVTDTGRIKSMADALRTAGFGDNVNQLASTVRNIIYIQKWSRAGTQIRGSGIARVDNQAVVDWVEVPANYTAVKKAMKKVTDDLWKDAKWLNQTMWGSMLFCMTKKDAEDAEYFMEKLSSGENMSKEGKDSPIYMLRNDLIRIDRESKRAKELGRSHVVRGPRGRDIHYRYIIRGWNHFRNKERIKKLVVDLTSPDLEKMI